MINKINFDYDFFENKFKKLGYNIKKTEIPIKLLRENKAIPSKMSLNKAYILYHDQLTFDIIFIQFDKLPSRQGMSRISRYWKMHQGGRQLIIFSDGKDACITVIPGALYEEGVKSRILMLSERLFRTDVDTLNSLLFVDDKKILRENYDNKFLPYEKVRNEFFEKYRDLYQEIYNKTKDYLGDNASSYAQRFLGRLMFLYFLQRKGWLKNDITFIDTIKDYKELNKIVYEDLSNEDTGFPYLDGTLFERESYFSEGIEDKLYDFMDNIFKKAREFLDSYNFTVDESSPLDVEVSLDPNMLGTIFENMLPENERGAKGTFYTPPEEISFICKEALSAYLKIPDKIDENGKKLKHGIEILIDQLELEKNENEIEKIRDKILNIRVLDPAVGSGGFLLGMMQEMLNLLFRIDEIIGYNTDPRIYKKRILTNLFGFDMEGEAIEIAKLRLWLSSIIEEKNPEPLENLDMYIMRIGDSLAQVDNVQTKLLDESLNLVLELKSLREEFLGEKSPEKRRKLRMELAKIQEEIHSKTGIYGGYIELLTLFENFDIIVMNPPYVRQEQIKKDKKLVYKKHYNLPPSSDLYAYFIVRSLKLLKDDGVAAVITSDKWLETGYGKSLQHRLSNKVINIFSQRKKVFSADVNSIIFVYENSADKDKNTHFVYLDSYSNLKIVNYNSFKRSELKCGKWFYLRAPKFFMENIYPKLTYKLENFSDVKFGIKTGANDFFYMKDVSSQYEADYLSNPDKFIKWGVNTKNEKELKENNLIYIENEGKNRFVINKEDTKPLLRSPKQISKYSVDKLSTLCLYTNLPGKFTQKYIEWGENQEVKVKGRNTTVKGYNKLETIKSRKPWYKLPDLKPSRIILPALPLDRLFIPFSNEPIIVDHTLYMLYAKNEDSLWLYLNSTFFLITTELFSRRLGGGGGALSIMVSDYEDMPVPDLKNINIKFDKNLLLSREPKIYYNEIKEKSKRELDIEVAKLLKFKNPEEAVNNLYKDYIWVVEDRLIKANRPLKSDNE